MSDQLCEQRNQLCEREKNNKLLLMDILHNYGHNVKKILKDATVDYENNKPIKLACAKGLLCTVQLLYEHGAKIDDYCVYICCQEGNLNVLKFILKKCKQKISKSNCIKLSSKNKQHTVTAYLIREQNCDPLLIPEIYRKEFVDYFIKAFPNNILEIDAIGTSFESYNNLFKNNYVEGLIFKKFPTHNFVEFFEEISLNDDIKKK